MSANRVLKRFTSHRTRRWSLFRSSRNLAIALVSIVSPSFTLPPRLSAFSLRYQHDASPCTCTTYLVKGRQGVLRRPHASFPLTFHPRHLSNPTSNSSFRPDLAFRLGWSYRQQRQYFHTSGRRDAIPLIPAAIGIFKVCTTASQAADEAVHLRTRRRYRHIPCSSFLLSDRYLRNVEDHAWCPVCVIRCDKAQTESRSRSILEDVV